MSLTASEIESLRLHLGYGNLSVAGVPYTSDGFQNYFSGIISDYLTTATETTSTTACTAGDITVVTVGSIGDIVAFSELLVDTGEDAEIVVVKAVAGSTFTARFTKAHAASGYPVMLMCGKARLRMLLNDANTLWRKLTGKEITQTAGIKQLGNGEIEWFDGGAVQRQVSMQYGAVVEQLAALCRMAPQKKSASTRLEVY
jgi:hypothetical protein